MTSRDFVYWLQGFFEIQEEYVTEEGLSGKQAKIIQQHLAMVFVHEIDPSMPNPALDELHSAQEPATLSKQDKPTDPASVPIQPSLPLHHHHTVYRC